MWHKYQENKLIKALVVGDESAYRELFDLYYSRVFKFTTSIIHDQQEAKDLAQNCFVKLWLNRDRLEHISSLNNYIFTIARNSACDYLRVKCRERKFQAATIAEKSSNYANIQIDYDTQVMEQTIISCIDTMPLQRKTAYKLSREEKFSNEEIAELMNISKRTVDRHLSIALKDIRTALSKVSTIS